MDRTLISYKLDADVVTAWREYIRSLNTPNVRKIIGDRPHRAYHGREAYCKKKKGSSAYADVVLEYIIRDYLQGQGVKV